jgi:hypothetical protein
MGLQHFYDEGPRPCLLLRTSSRATRGEITISVIYNCPNYCEICTVYTQFTNVAAGHGLDTHALKECAVAAGQSGKTVK